MREYFDARDHRLAEIRRERTRLEQYAIYAAPDHHPAAARLDMEIGRTRGRRFAKGAIHEIDDRRLKSEILDVVDVFFVDLGRPRARSAVQRGFMYRRLTIAD